MYHHIQIMDDAVNQIPRYQKTTDVRERSAITYNYFARNTAPRRAYKILPHGYETRT